MATWLRILLIALASAALHVGCEDDPTDLDHLKKAADAGTDAGSEEPDPPGPDEDAG